MAITVKHSKVSTIPDADDDALVRPSDWNASHTLVGTIDVPNGGTGASTLTGYVKGNGTSAMTASATIPSGDVSGLGTIATQNANAVAISGGTINGTTIGATTPAAITATTITGQTEVLKGTGQNLLTFSNPVTGNWNVFSGSLTNNATTDPFGGSTASAFTLSGTTTGFYKSLSVVSGLVYTQSIYIKAGTLGSFVLNCQATATVYSVTFNVSAGTITSTSGTGTSSIVSVGNGWYRCIATFTAAASGTGFIEVDCTGTAGQIIYAYGGQQEIGSTANTYIPTTTTAVYGTPTLSFSGVAGLGLESNGSLYVSPAGTGAIQAQATTSTTAGGNARGANAVDFQTLRSTASMVASSTGSVLVGGQNNTSSAYTSFVGAGANNYAQSGNSFVGSGNANVINGGGSYGAIVAGGSNAISSPYTFIGGGLSNTGAGYYNFIGGGFTNSGTALAAVTTQSGTMNATTAVTLSGSNANIKVGQYITGTSIAGDTYVAAISGTALTLSKNASGSSTSTLSFFTPHGVVVGGGNNQATGSYSFIGGGGDAGTAANRNVASGDWSTVGGGLRNSVSNNYSSVLGGQQNSVSSNHCFIGGGTFNSVSNSYSSVVGGYQNTASGGNSVVTGGTFGTTRSITGFQTFTGNDNALGSGATGTIQSGLLVLGKQTTDATATALTSSNSGASGINQVILPNNSAYFFTGEVVSGVTGGGDTKGWTIEGVIKRGANAASTALVGTPTVTSTYADAGASTWAIAVTADTTNGGIRVTFTGQAATTIRTVCRISSVEMTY